MVEAATGQGFEFPSVRKTPQVAGQPNECNDMRKLPTKKSEVIELRLPYETKIAFMAKVRSEGTTASAAMRQYIDRYLEGSAERRHILEPKEKPMSPQSKNDPMILAGRTWRPALAAFTTLLGLGVVVLVISPAKAVPDLADAFKHLDATGFTWGHAHSAPANVTLGSS
jgi:hypothetical protein